MCGAAAVEELTNSGTDRDQLDAVRGSDSLMAARSRACLVVPSCCFKVGESRRALCNSPSLLWHKEYLKW